MILLKTFPKRWQLRLFVLVVMLLAPLVNWLTFPSHYPELAADQSPSLWWFWTVLGGFGAVAVVLPLTWVSSEYYRGGESLFNVQLRPFTLRRFFAVFLFVGLCFFAITSVMSFIHYHTLLDLGYSFVLLFCGLNILTSSGTPSS